MNSKKKILLIFISILLLSSNFLNAQRKNATQPTRILFIFDASASMYGRWQTGMKMDIAKQMLTEFLDSLQVINNLEIAFRAYGHQYFLQPQRNCQDTKLEVPFASSTTNALLIKNKLKTITPRGTTPIAYTLEQCGNDFPDNNARNIVILITDGIEECDGDPCAISRALQAKGIILKPFIIGVGLDENFAKTFECVGKFYDVSDERNFKSVLDIVISQALNNTTAQVNLLDIAGRPLETDVNMTFYDDYSGAIRYNYVHTMNSKGNPDTIILDPLSTYRMVVNTIPPVEKTGIEIIPGKHNIISVDAPQGYLNLRVNGINYKSLQAIVRKNGEMQTLNLQDFNRTEKYIMGNYDLEILSLPRLYFNNINIFQSKTTTIEIPQSGSVTIMKPSEGPGSVYVEENNQLKWVCNIKDFLTQETIPLQPGNYRVMYRPKNAKSTIYTVERKFKIDSGATTTAKLY